MECLSRKNPYFTWGCSEEFALQLQKTLYCTEVDDCYDVSSIALTDMAVTMLKETSQSSRRKITQRYASSLTRQLSISPCALIMSILYSERLRQSNPGYLDKISSSDLYVISMLVATKFLHDEGEQEEIYNDEWAQAAGLAVSTVNRLEREFLDAIDWQIYVKPDEFLTFCSKIESRIALKYGMQRGWFSYTDLTRLLLAVQVQTILKEFVEKTLKVICGCALVYGMSLSLLISTALAYSAVTSHPPQHTTINSSHITPMDSSRQQSNSNSSPLVSDLFSERPLTRIRKFQLGGVRKTQNDITLTHQHKNETGGVGDSHNEALLERLKNTTTTDDVTMPKTRCHHHTPPLRFESRFQHGARQTRLSISFDMIEDLQQRDRIGTFVKTDFSAYHHDDFSQDTGGGECNKDLHWGGGNVKAEHEQHPYHPSSPLAHLFRRKPKNNAIYLHPRLFGMTVI